VLEKMPVSISIGLWTTLIGYLISIPLGIAKATREGSRFDLWTTAVITAGQAIPGFLFAILLIVIFAGGRYFHWFPLSGLVSSNWHELSWPALIVDYLWHMALPILAMVIGSFASLTLLTKNSFLDQLRMLYVSTARAKGLSERQVLYGHVFRNAMLIVISGFPGRDHRHLLHGCGAHRDDLLPRRPWIARLRGRDQSRLSDHVRDALFLLSPRTHHQSRGRPDLHARRSTDRLRTQRRMTPATTRRFLGLQVTPIMARRWRNFRSNKRGFWSTWIFLAVFFVTVPAEFIANDRPLVVSCNGHLYFPVVADYPETLLAVISKRRPTTEIRMLSTSFKRAAGSFGR